MTASSIEFPPLRRSALTTLQVNLGYRCNQSCSHCHVNAGPTRTEMMGPELLDLIPEVLRRRAIGCLDLTGGAPELHPGFRELVVRARRLGVRVLDRCNLTILSEPGQETLAAFLAEQGLDVAPINKVLEGRPHIVDAMKNGDVQLVVNTTEGEQSLADSKSIRRTALVMKIPYYTTMAGAEAAIAAIRALSAQELGVRSLQDYAGIGN